MRGELLLEAGLGAPTLTAGQAPLAIALEGLAGATSDIIGIEPGIVADGLEIAAVAEEPFEGIVAGALGLGLT